MHVGGHRDARIAIRLALALSYFNFVATGAARVVLTLYALELGAPASVVGILGGLLFLFPLLLSWPIGAAADRMGARGLLMFGSACGAVSLALPFFFRALPVFYVAAALNGLALAFFHVTLQNVIGVMSTPEDRARNFSNFSLTGSLTNFVGPLLAGFSIDTMGHAAACLVAASQSAIAVVLLLVWGHAYPPGGSAQPHAPGANTGLLDRDVVRMLVVSAMVQLGYDLFQFYLPIYAHSIGLSASAIGTILGLVFVAALVIRGVLPVLVKKLREAVILTAAMFIAAAAFILLPFFERGYTLGAIAFLLGLGVGCAQPMTMSLLYVMTPAGRIAEAVGLQKTVRNATHLVVPILFGSVGAMFGVTTVFLSNATILAVSGMLMKKAGIPDTTSSKQ